MTVTIRRASLDAVHAHARATYPEECCGFIIERGGQEEVVRVTNIQNELHARDPGQFQRTAATAYSMGREQIPIILGAERGALTIRGIYHSHPEHDAYFSATDRDQALGGADAPTYPDAVQIVVSVRDGDVRATKAFAWDAAARDFLEIELVSGS
jgi:adenylyltransferase/sulfurtransferase